MAYQFHILNANSSLDPYAESIAIACKQALAHINKYISLDGVDVIVYDAPNKIIPELGASGGFLKQDQVEVYLDTSLPNFKSILKDIFPPLLAHELHHWRRWREGVFGCTLLDAFIAEGMAVHFENELFPSNSPFYAHSLNDKDLLAMEADAFAHYSKEDYDHQYWFFGSQPEVYRKWAGYSLGFSLLKRHFSKHPGDKASNVIDKPSLLFELAL